MANSHFDSAQDLQIAKDYASLKSVLNRAYLQASAGKGKERHAGGLPFDAQPMQLLSNAMGDCGGLIFQACKKASEGYKIAKLPAALSKARAVAEMLGAINYLAGAVVWLEKAEMLETEQARQLAE